MAREIVMEPMRIIGQVATTATDYDTNKIVWWAAMTLLLGTAVWAAAYVITQLRIAHIQRQLERDAYRWYTFRQRDYWDDKL